MSEYSDNLIRVFELEPGMPLLDEEQVLMLKSAGEELLDELAETFENECAPRLDLIEQNCLTSDLDELRQNIHFIAGSAANIGLFRLAELCRNVEMQIKEGRFAAFELTPTYVRVEFTHGLAELADA